MRALSGLSSRERAAFRRKLLAWYRRHGRDLPWRRTRDPYAIWVSEVMLQQTRVAAVLERYSQFMQRFPAIKALAKASEADVLAAWSGLGYYRRARGLHAAARELARAAGRRPPALPQTSEELRQLPGIGRYTAAAIASIAFDEPLAVVDGNVERVLQRLFHNAGLDHWAEAQALLDARRPGDWNQAVMELGATVCTPLAPRCAECPVRKHCVTSAGGTLPRMSSVKHRLRRLQIAYCLCARAGKVLLVRRSLDASLMAGMWELPGCTRANEDPILRLKHSITNTVYDVTVHRGRSAQVSAQGRWVSTAKLPAMPLTGLARKILKRMEIMA